MITFLKRLAAAVPTPATDKVTLFVDDGTGLPSYKDDAGAVTSLEGPRGVGIPTGGTTGQVLAKQSGTDYDTAWTAAGSGDVVGPVSATDGHIATYDGATGKLIEDGGASIADVRAIPQNSQSAAYTLVLADAGGHTYHPSADTTARIWTIPANASVAFPIGTAVTFVNDVGAGAITLAITSDTLVLAGVGSTGSRTLAAAGMATAIKVTSTRWLISGTNLT